LEYGTPCAPSAYGWQGVAERLEKKGGNHHGNVRALDSAGDRVLFRCAGKWIGTIGAGARATFVYGGGTDCRVFRQLALRLEYRGPVYIRRDFAIPMLPSHVTTRTAQPSAGIVLHF